MAEEALFPANDVPPAPNDWSTAANNRQHIGYSEQIHQHGHVRLIDFMGDDMRIAEVARVSYREPSKGPQKDARLIRYLAKHAHTSPFEHVKITFCIRMPIFCQRQFIRHRMQNYNEESGRYKELRDDCYLPTVFYAQGEAGDKQQAGELLNDNLNTAARSDMARAYRSARMTYERLINAGVAREQARLVLPLGLYTEFYATWDLNNLMKFLALRDHPKAQKEIQEYARAMKRIAYRLFPVAMGAFDDLRQDRSEERARVIVDYLTGTVQPVDHDATVKEMAAMIRGVPMAEIMAQRPPVPVDVVKEKRINPDGTVNVATE